jgi:hypothetical protein
MQHEANLRAVQSSGACWKETSHESGAQHSFLSALTLASERRIAQSSTTETSSMAAQCFSLSTAGARTVHFKTASSVVLKLNWRMESESKRVLRSRRLNLGGANLEEVTGKEVWRTRDSDPGFLDDDQHPLGGYRFRSWCLFEPHLLLRLCPSTALTRCTDHSFVGFPDTPAHAHSPMSASARVPARARVSIAENAGKGTQCCSARYKSPPLC